MTVTVIADAADRIDKVIARRYPTAGRTQLAELFADGCVHVGGRRARKGDRVAPGDVIELAREPVGPEGKRPQPDRALADRLVILLERPELIAIDKPTGVPSQPLRAGELGTIANALAARFPECASIGDDPRDGGLVHRLDIGTSGVLLAARTADSYRDLRAALSAGRVVKSYLAIVDGRPVARSCEEPLAQRGDHVVVDHGDGLAAHTEFTVERASTGHALVRCTAHSGRMHQVRAHLAHVGSPISGDARYGGRPIGGDDGFFLHAESIAIPGYEVIIAPLPERFVAALATVIPERA